MNISSTTAAYQTQQIQASHQTPRQQTTNDAEKSKGDTVTISEEARKAQSNETATNSEALLYFPESVRQYLPDCRTLDIEVGKYGPVYKKEATSEQVETWPEYSDELMRVYNACLQKHGLSGGLELEQMSSKFQEDFEKDLHQMFSDDPNKERIQELMDIMGVNVEKL